jgi:hypothetical protein
LSRVQKAAIAGGTTVGLALGGAGIAFAAGSSTSTSTPSTTKPAAPPSGAPGTRPGPGPRFSFGFGGPDGFGRFGSAVHGQVTVPNGTNAYKTIEFQIGTVSSKPTTGATSITVHSADGYTHTYTVTTSTQVDAQRDGIGSIAHGDTVTVLATPISGKDTATSIVDTTKIGSSRSGFGLPTGPDRPGGPAGPGARTGSAGSAGSTWSGEGHGQFGATTA